jgi:hypothetical protein
MTEKSHWPFGDDAGKAHEAAAKKEQDLAREKARVAEDAAHRLQLRNDRLLVGGRAHAKKPGLS